MALAREGLFLALDQVSDPGSGDVDHIGFDVDAAEIADQETRNEALGATTVAKRDDLLVFLDRYGRPGS